MRITTGEPSGALSVAHRRCMATARRARLRAFSCSVLFSPGTQPVDAMKASLAVSAEGGGEKRKRVGASQHGVEMTRMIKKMGAL